MKKYFLSLKEKILYRKLRLEISFVVTDIFLNTHKLVPVEEIIPMVDVYLPDVSDSKINYLLYSYNTIYFRINYSQNAEKKVSINLISAYSFNDHFKSYFIIDNEEIIIKWISDLFDNYIIGLPKEETISNFKHFFTKEKLKLL